MSGLPVPRLADAGAPRPLRPVRLLALDLDGTTLDLDQRLHPRTFEVVHGAVAGGLHVVVATGRMYRSALPWGKLLGLRDPLICYQGALVRAMPAPGDPEHDGVVQGAVVAEWPLAGGPALTALDVARRGGWHVQAYRDDRLLGERSGPDADFYCRIAQVEMDLVPDLADLMALGSTKVVCVVLDAAGAARCESALREALGPAARVVRSLPQFVEVTDPRAGKARALRAVCDRLGVGLDEVVAAGDAPNDVDMLEAAGFAAAVEGAHADVLRAADVIIPAPENGGVAELIEAVRARVA